MSFGNIGEKSQVGQGTLGADLLQFKSILSRGDCKDFAQETFEEPYGNNHMKQYSDACRSHKCIDKHVGRKNRSIKTLRQWCAWPVKRITRSF